MSRFEVHYRVDPITNKEILQGGGAIFDRATKRFHPRPDYSPGELHETVEYLNARHEGYPQRVKYVSV